jgi:PAS domain S-box-containing protein
MALTGAVGLAVLTLSEVTKRLAFPDITLWQSHVLTILFGAALASAVAYPLLRRQARLHQRAAREVDARRAAEERLLGVLGSLDDVVWSLAPDTLGPTYLSPAAERVYGRPVAEFLANPRLWLEVIHPEDRERIAAGLRTALAEGAGETEYRIVRPGDEVRWVRASARLVRDAHGTPLRLDGLVTDLTERKRAEEALREREERIRLLLDSTAEAIYGLDTQGNCTFCNRACVRLLGYADARDLLGKKLHGLIHHKRADGTLYAEGQCRIDQAFRRGEGTHADDEVLWRADGSSCPTEYWSHPVRRGAELVGAVVTFLDISERRRLEEQFRQSQKMDAVGRLAGGVAHDFNNLLTIISGYAELLLGRFPRGDPTRDLVKEIAAAGERAAALTRQLLAFSRKQILAPRVLSLQEVLAGMEKMLRRLLGEDIDLVTVLDPNLGLVKADPGQIEQVIMNVAVNARDAMPQGGRLTIEARNVEPDGSGQRSNPAARPGPHVLLALTDTGVGMDPTVQARIFEPFFTTKGEKGTGLGLATVYGIVELSGGHIHVSSTPGLGTTFQIYLPRVEGKAPGGKSTSGLGTLPYGTETVLLVEDEDAVRALAHKVLRAAGYNVLDAGEGTRPWAWPSGTCRESTCWSPTW